MANFKTLTELYLNKPIDGESKAQDDAARFVEMRYFNMSNAKVQVRSIWQGTQQLYYANDWEWIMTGEDWNRPVRFPTLRDFVKALTDTFMKDPPDIFMKAKNEEEAKLAIGKKAYIDSRRDSIYEKRVRRQVIEDMFFYGVGLREFMCVLDKSGFKQICSRRIDPRNYFVDESTNRLHDPYGFEQARDDIIRDVMPFSTFVQRFKNLPGFNIAGVTPQNWYTQDAGDYWATNNRELIEKSPVQVAKVYEYRNPADDLYIVVSGGKTIYEGSLKKAKGIQRLTTVDYQFEVRNDSFWGNNLATLIAPHIYAKDVLLNLELMNLKLTLQPVVAVSGDFGYNPRVHVMQPGGVWTAGSNMNGKISDNIQPLIAGNPNTNVYNMLQNLNSELSVTARSDIRSLTYYEDKTATEVVRQNQVMNAHNETIESIAEVESEAVGWELACELMEACMDATDENGNKRTVQIEGYVVKRTEDEADFIEKTGYKDIFQLTDKMINVPVEMTVLDKRSKAAQNVERFGSILQVLPLVNNLAQLDPQTLKHLDVAGLIEQAIEVAGLDLERSFKKDGNEYDDEFEMAKEEILLGHTVDVIEETREESLARLKYFLAFQKKMEKRIKPYQIQALNYHLDQILRNITRDHLADYRMQQEQEKMAAMGQMTPNMSAGQIQQAQAVQKTNQKQEQMGSPDIRALNTAGSPANRLQ